MSPEAVTFAIGDVVSPAEIIALREAVGWGGLSQDYPAAFAGYWATVSGREHNGNLVAWCAIISDRVRHAILIDVIVHPSRQRQGVGLALVTKALTHIREQGITVVHVDSTDDNIPFYERCGFQSGWGGIIEFS